MLLVNHTREEAVAMMKRANVDGVVGPTSPTGWTCVAPDAGPDCVARLGFESYACAYEGPRGVVFQAQLPGAADLVMQASEASAHARVEALARSVAAHFGPPEAVDGVADLLRRTDLRYKDVRHGLAELLDLPELTPPRPERALVLTRSAHRPAIAADAAIAGPAWLAALDSRWTLVVPATMLHAEDQRLASAVSAAGRRRDRTVLLWQGRDCVGLQIWANGDLDTSWSWGTGWEHVVADWVEFESHACASIERVADHVDGSTLRSLLRRPALDPDRLDTLVSQVGLPPRVVDLLDGSLAPEQVEGAELIAKATPVLHGRHGRDGRGVRRRAQHGSPRRRAMAAAVLTSVAAVACLVLAVVGSVMVLTDGAFLDEPGVTVIDTLILVAIAVPALVLGPAAVHQLRRLRDRQHD